MSLPWQVTTFLLSDAGAAAVASGKFNATGQRLVAALPANLDSLDAKVDNLADEINVEVRLRLHHHSLSSSDFATVLPQYGNNTPYPASTKRDNLLAEIKVKVRVDHLRVASKNHSRLFNLLRRRSGRPCGRNRRGGGEGSLVRFSRGGACDAAVKSARGAVPPA